MRGWWGAHRKEVVDLKKGKIHFRGESGAGRAHRGETNKLKGIGRACWGVPPNPSLSSVVGTNNRMPVRELPFTEGERGGGKDTGLERFRK